MATVEIDNLLEARDGDAIEMLVSDLVAKLQKALDEMPAETRESACVLLRCYGDYSVTYLSLIRDETKDERAAREAKDAERGAQYVMFRDDCERREFERLKAKFEST